MKRSDKHGVKPSFQPFERLHGFAEADRGSVVVIAVVFVMIFLIMGIALYWLIISQTRSTETERTDVKAFNVAEAGVDAGMLSLKLAWPEKSSDVAFVDNAVLKTAITAGTQGLWDPSRSDPGKFIDVTLYDNVDAAGQGTAVAYPDAPKWDSNGDGRMFVDATANVGDNRHRILVLAERQNWQLTFPAGIALFANVVDSNGQGLEVSVEDPNPVPTVPYAFYDVHDAQHKGVAQGYGIATTGSPTTFDSIVNEALRTTLEGIARSQQTYFESANEANALLAAGETAGKVIYVKASSAVTISGSTKIGTVDNPTVIVIDTPDGSANTWDMKGNADLYGILITIGNSTLRGTSAVHGAVYCKGTLTNKGNGSSGEINYNETVIMNINRSHVISVNIVPNTWEEYSPVISSNGNAG